MDNLTRRMKVSDISQRDSGSHNRDSGILLFLVRKIHKNDVGRPITLPTIIFCQELLLLKDFGHIQFRRGIFMDLGL